MSDAILSVNSGSSSIKFALYAAAQAHSDPEMLAEGTVDGIGSDPVLSIREGKTEILRKAFADKPNHEQLLRFVLGWVSDRIGNSRLAAAGHRVVHGGTAFSEPVIVDGQVLESLERLVPLAPLHQPHNLAAIRILAEAMPELLQIACFDTAFHRTNSVLASSFALPRHLTQEGLRRYGFHGLSYEYIASALPHIAGSRRDDRVVIAHLGYGASLCAMSRRKSIATTMGFTALDGLVMGQRCGAIDPGVLLYLIKEKGMGYEALSDLLYKQSGLLGVSGLSGDMRTLLASPAAEAKEAVDLFVYRICRELGSLTAALGGLDVLVFTGGIGEHAAIVRKAVCDQARWLGIALDEVANEESTSCISAPHSSAMVLVIPTDEALMIARHTNRFLRIR